MADISEIDWGDVVSDDDGVLVIRGVLNDSPVVVKRFAGAARREIAVYRALIQAGVPTIPLHGSGEDWLILDDLRNAGFRPGTEADLADPVVAVLLARWYEALHAVDPDVAEAAGHYSELDLIDDDALRRVEACWPATGAMLTHARASLEQWQQEYATLPHTLTHNDFWYTNLAVAWDGSSALMFDYNLTGSGLRSSDLRNVTSGLSAPAGEVFLTEYLKLIEKKGIELSPAETQLDTQTSHLVALILAAESGHTPAWVLPSLRWAQSFHP